MLTAINIGFQANNAIFMSFPFLVVRLSFACLGLFQEKDKWNPLFGSIAALVCMHSLMEYIVVLIALFTAFSIPAARGVEWRRTDPVGAKVQSRDEERV
jgi:hypothetical protein